MLIPAFQNFAKTLIKCVFVLNNWIVSCYAFGSPGLKSPSVVGECLNCCFLAVCLVKTTKILVVQLVFSL